MNRIALAALLLSACGDAQSLRFNVTLGPPAFEGDNTGAGGSRIKGASDTLPIPLAIYVTVDLQDPDTGAFSETSGIDELTLQIPSSAPCSVKMQPTCSATICQGVIQLDRYGVCVAGLQGKTPEATGSACWEQSVIDGPSVADADTNAARDAAIVACEAQF